MAIQFHGLGTAAVFAPLESSTRSELVARRLTDAIALGLLPDGEQLPGEADLAATFRVSTVTVREALATLRHDRLIETRRGRGGGSFVRTPSEGPTSIARQRLDSFSLLDLRDLGDVYAAVSGSCAALAARRASPEDVDRLHRAADRLAAADNPGERRRTDAHFHVEVAVAAQSPRLFHEEVALQAEFGTLLWLAFGDDASHSEVVGSCRAVVDAVKRRDSAAARAAAETRVAEATARLIDFRLDQED